jgi:hypothetical protein
MPVPSHATQRMYNIQFNLLISQHVSTVFRPSSGEYNCLPNALLNCKPSYFFLHGPIFAIIILVDDNTDIHQYYVLNYHSLTHSLTHGVEPFLKSSQLCSYSRTSQHFTEPEGSLPCSQEPSTSPYSEPDQFNPYHPIPSKIHFNIVHPPTSWSSQWSLSLWHSHQYPIFIKLLNSKILKIRNCYIKLLKYDNRCMT